MWQKKAYENQQQGINKISEISQKMVGNDEPKKVKFQLLKDTTFCKTDYLPDYILPNM